MEDLGILKRQRTASLARSQKQNGKEAESASLRGRPELETAFLRKIENRRRK